MAKNNMNEPVDRSENVTADKLQGKLNVGESQGNGDGISSDFDINELLREYMAEAAEDGSPETSDLNLFKDVKADPDVSNREEEQTKVYIPELSKENDFDFGENPDSYDSNLKNEFVFEDSENKPEPEYDDADDEMNWQYSASDDRAVPIGEYFDAADDESVVGDYQTEPQNEYELESNEISDYEMQEPASDEAFDMSDEADEAQSTESEIEEDGTIMLPADMDETDINLMVALGLEDELAKTVGTKTAEKLTEKIENEHMERIHSDRGDPSKEFMSEEQIPEIAGKFRRMYTFSNIRLILGALLLLAIALYENLSLFGIQFGGALDPAVYPVVYVMVDLQLVLFGCALAFDLLKRGFFNLFTGKISPESITFVMAVASLIYSGLTAAYASVPNEPVLFNLPVMLGLFMSMLYGHWRIKREIFSFNVVSSSGPKYIIRRLNSKDAAVEAEAFGDKDGNAGDVLKIEQTDFVDGFFKRTNGKVYSNSAFITLALILSVALALITAVFAGISSKSGSPVSDGLNVLFIGLVAALPLSMFFTYGYPFYKANKDAYENDSAIVGENSLEEYTGASMITFDDKNVFPSYSVKVQNVRIYNNYRIDKVLYYATSVFAKTQGPLGDVFSVATAEMGHSDDVEIIDSGNGYIEAEVDDKNIIFGRAYDLVDLGVSIPKQIIEEDEELDDDISVMYMIYQQQLVAKLHVRYIIDPDFEYILKRLSGSGMYVCIRTFDPNIDEEMIYRRIKKRRSPIRVLKYKSTDELVQSSEHSEGGIVTRGNSKNLLQTVTSCDKVLNVKKTNAMLSIITVIMSIALLFILVLSGRLESISSVYLLANQVFWMIPMMISSKLIVG